MHAVLESSCSALDIDLPHLRESARFSLDVLKTFREELPKAVDPTDEECLDVILFGSFARMEANKASDLDYVVAVHRLPDDVRRTRRFVEAVANIQKRMGLKDPGRSRMFGTVMSVADIAERIGLEQDTNQNLTRRILVFQESTSVHAEDLFERLLRSLLERYLESYKMPKKGVPRFLLNDVVRYWRTVAVDYQAKRWDSLQQDWGLRYIKLLVSRKLAFAGTLASILRTEEATVEYFIEQFRMPALARLAQLEASLDGDARRALGEILRIADEFVGLLADQSFREEAMAIESADRIAAGSRFADMRERARELQRKLEIVFFESWLRDRAVQYLSF